MGNCLRSASPTLRVQGLHTLSRHDLPTQKWKELQKPHPRFSLAGQINLGYCPQAYDGDTCTMNIQSSIGHHQWKVRLNDLDAPEMKTLDMEEKIHALACRNMLLELIQDKYCIVMCDSWEKYGRLLGTIFIRSEICNLQKIVTLSCEEDDLKKFQDQFPHPDTKTEEKAQLIKGSFLNVNQWMLHHTPCVPYTGGTKEKILFHGPYHPHYEAHLIQCRQSLSKSHKNNKKN